MKDQILDAAVRLAIKHGYKNVTRDLIADSAEVATGTVTYHLGPMHKLRRAIVAKAIEIENIKIFTEALVDQHPLALAAPAHLKLKASLLLRQ